MSLNQATKPGGIQLRNSPSLDAVRLPEDVVKKPAKSDQPRASDVVTYGTLTQDDLITISETARIETWHLFDKEKKELKKQGITPG